MAEDTGTRSARIIVGVDGSQPSKAALRWAIEYGALTGAGITAVTAWQYPADFSYGMTPPAPAEVWHPDTDAAQALEETLQEVLGDDRPAGLEIVVCEGNPAKVLLERSAGARVLVVGSRGHGGFAGLLLGSVSSACAEHARCPVLVVH